MKHTAKELVLNSGARGLILHVPHASVMSFYISFRAGEYLVNKKIWEAPHIMEHMVLCANTQYPRGRDFQAEFEKNGAYSNASTSVHDVTYEAECADFEWERILDCLIAAVSGPLFLEDEFQAEVGNVREELSARSNNHYRHLNLALKQAYKLSAITYKDRLNLMENVTLEDVIAHYKKTHQSPNMRFIIAGNVDPSREKAIKSKFEQISLPVNQQRFKLPIERPRGLAKPLFISNDTVENFYFYIDTFLKRRMEEPELYAMSLLNSLLTETLYSKIWGTARERGLLYGMSSSIGYEQDYTNWWFGAQVRPQNAPAVMNIIISELMKVFEGRLSEREVEAAQQYQLGRFQRGAQTVNGIAQGYMGRYFMEDYIDDFYAIPDKIKSVTKDQMVEAAKQMFVDHNWGFGVLGGNDESIVKTLHKQISPLWQLV